MSTSKREKVLTFRFTETEAEFVSDGLAHLIEDYGEHTRSLEDGEQMELDFAKELKARIGKRLGIE